MFTRTNMKEFLKNTIKKNIQSLTTLLSSTKVGRLVSEVIVNDVMNRVLEMEHKGVRINNICYENFRH